MTNIDNNYLTILLSFISNTSTKENIFFNIFFPKTYLFGLLLLFQIYN
jgi:hypothetical protein